MLIVMPWPLCFSVPGQSHYILLGVHSQTIFLPSCSLSGATDIPPFLSTRARLDQSCQRPRWQLQRQPSGSPALLHPFQNLWDYFLSSTILRYAPLMTNSCSSCVYMCNLGNKTKAWILLNVSVWSIQLIWAAQTLPTPAKWIFYPNSRDTLSRTSMSWMAEEWSTRGLAGC